MGLILTLIIQLGGGRDKGNHTHRSRSSIFKRLTGVINLDLRLWFPRQRPTQEHNTVLCKILTQNCFHDTDPGEWEILPSNVLQIIEVKFLPHAPRPREWQIPASNVLRIIKGKYIIYPDCYASSVTLFLSRPFGVSE